MTHITKRCKHCNTVYGYQASGTGCDNKDNDPIYCPDCMHIINNVLLKVPIKFERKTLPTKEVTIEEFKTKYADYRKKLEAENPLASIIQRVTFGPNNFEYKYMDINNVDYILITNKTTGEELLEVEYEQNCKTKELTGLWYKYEKS